MAERFNLTAQLQLQAPTNTRQVVSQIRSQLGNINANVNVQANSKAISQTSSALQATAKNAKQAGRDVGVLNRNLSEAARRFGVITLATGTMLSFAQAVKRAVGEAIAFERELVKISQVTGKSIQDLSRLTQEITRLSTSLGASSSQLLETSRVLAQAGFSATKTRQALDILAKTTLGPTFDNISNTVEGAIAVLRQFRTEAQQAGGDIKFLESTLDAINSVSKSFAVESSDLITVIRRVGGVFSAAGGSVNELIALFTSVRATTRESAETISTGLRTIFTRIQRTDTVNQLENLGISLRDAQGQFVGAYEAVRRLSIGLSALDPRDYRFSEIVEQLGGFRQIGKVIPLIQQFSVAQDALNVAQNASGSVALDAATAQQSLAVQAGKVREEFSALIRQLTRSDTFKSIASGALELARALIRIGEALEPVLPLLTSFLTLKIGQGLAPGLTALLGAGGRRRGMNAGGQVHAFARGGYVPGSGNRDTVPAMLMPGEFVIKKSSASSLGPDTLNAMNNNRFNRGTTGKGIREELARTRKGGVGTADTVTTSVNKLLIGSASKAEALSDVETYGAAYLRPLGSGQNYVGTNSPAGIRKAIEATPGYRALLKNKDIQIGRKRPGSVALTGANRIIDKYTADNKYNLQASSLSQGTSTALEDTLLSGVTGAVQSGVAVLERDLAIQGNTNTAAALKQANIDQTIGNLFESVLTFAGSPFGGGDRDAANAPFDFPKGLGATAGKFPGLPAGAQTDAKLTYNADSIRSIINKVNNKNAIEAQTELDPIITNLAAQVGSEVTKAELLKGLTPQKKASGGQVDTVPALLTPGEFVINKKAAQSVGYSNLNRMNKSGVARFNRGGSVGVRRYANGTGAGGVLPAVGAGDFFAGNYDFASDAQASFDEGLIGASAALKDLTGAVEKSTGMTEKVTSAQAKFEKDKQKDTLVLAKHIQSTEEGIRGDQALAKAKKIINQRYSSWSPVVASAQQETQTFIQKLKSSRLGQGVGAAVSAGGQIAQGAASGLQRLEGIAGAAQQFVFLGASAAALAGQFGGLEETTQKAVTETAAYAASLVGIGGTVLQLASSLARAVTGSLASATADTAEAGASKISAQADLEEAVSSKAAAGAGLAKAASDAVTGFALGAAAAIAMSIVFKLAAATLRAEADKLQAGADKQLEGIREGTSPVAGFAEASLAAAETRSQANVKDAQSRGALSSGIGGAAAGAVTGAIIGSFLPGIGTAIGAVVGGLVGGLAGAAYGALSSYSEATDKAREDVGKFGVALVKTADNLGYLIQANRKFAQALSDIDIEKNLEPEERVSRRIDATQGQARNNMSGIAKANAQMARLAEDLNKPISQLTEADFKDAPVAAGLFKVASATLQEGQSTLGKIVAESRKTLAEAAKLELTGDMSFDEVVASGGLFAQALKASQEAIRQEAIMRIITMEQALKTEEKGSERAKQLQKEINSTQERMNQQLKDQEEGYRKVSEQAERNKESLERSRRAQEAYRRELMKIKNFSNALVDATDRLNQLEQTLGNLSAYESESNMDFTRTTPEGLSDLSLVGSNNAEFDRQVDNMAANFGEGGKELAEKIKRTADIIAKGEKELIGQFRDPKGENVISADQALKMLGLSEADFGGAFDKFKEDYAKAIEDGVIDENEFNDLFGPVIGQGQKAADAFQKANDLMNKELNLRQSYLDILFKQRDKEVEARQSLTDTLLKATELRAQARGQEIGIDVTPGGGLRNVREEFRQQRAQQALQGIRTDPVADRGQQIRAGDVDAIQKARMAADVRRQEIQTQLKDPTTDEATRKKLITEEKQMANVVAKTTQELERLTDQSELAAEIMGEIDKERSKREAVTGVIEDFVVGGDDARLNINKSLAGVQNALATGTLQGQDEEQRSRTVGLLDRLADVQIPGAGGMTGKQVKQQLVFDDAVRMGLDPNVARMLATATSKEEKLISALDRLTKQMTDAANANVAFQQQKTDFIEGQAPIDPKTGKPMPIPRRGDPVAAGISAKDRQQQELDNRRRRNIAAREKRKREREGLASSGPPSGGRFGGGIPGATPLPQRERGPFGASQTTSGFSPYSDQYATGGRPMGQEVTATTKPVPVEIKRAPTGATGVASITDRSKAKSTYEAATKSGLDPQYAKKLAIKAGGGMLEEERSKIPFQAGGQEVQNVFVVNLTEMGDMMISAVSQMQQATNKVLSQPSSSTTVQDQRPNPNLESASSAFIGGLQEGFRNITGALTSPLENVVGQFSSSFDNIVTAFAGIQNSLDTLLQSINNMNVNHTVSVEGLINIGGLNIESIKTELSSSIGQVVAMEVQRSMNERNRGFDAPD